jgi:hypothetical protein
MPIPNNMTMTLLGRYAGLRAIAAGQNWSSGESKMEQILYLPKPQMTPVTNGWSICTPNLVKPWPRSSHTLTLPSVVFTDNETSFSMEVGLRESPSGPASVRQLHWWGLEWTESFMRGSRAGRNLKNLQRSLRRVSPWSEHRWVEK